jgi:hypothetical protein
MSDGVGEMVQLRLPTNSRISELEVSPDCSQASSLSAEEIVVVYDRSTKSPSR